VRGARQARSRSLGARLGVWYASSAFGLVVLVTGFLYWAMARSLEQQEAELVRDRLYTLIAELTYLCRLRCAYCSNPTDLASHPDRLQTSDWLRVFQQARQVVEDPKLDPGAAWYEARNLLRQSLRHELATLSSLLEFAGSNPHASGHEKTLADQVATFNAWIDSQARARGAQGTEPKAPWVGGAAAQKIPVRTGGFGPLTYQNDNVLLARLGPERMARIKLLNSEATPQLNAQDLSDLYAYEIVNFVDGKRSVGEIRDAVSAEYGPLPVDLVEDYLKACQEAGLIQWK